MRDYYEILQVSRNAEPEVIVAAYRRLARKYHPDAYAGADSNVRMRELNEAYEVLSDSARREAYDRARHYARSDAPSPPHKRRQERRKTARSPSRKPAPRRKPIVYGLLAVVVLGIGIAGGVWISVREAEQEDVPIPALTVGTLRNGTYPSEWQGSGQVTLVDGRFVGELPYDGGVFTLTVTLADEIGFGDLDGDYEDDAAVVIGTNGGGSGTFYELVAVLNSAGSPSPVATESLGDRVIIDSVSVVAGRIELDMTTHGTGDGLCCPSNPVSRVYVLGDSGLLLLEEVGRPGG